MPAPFAPLMRSLKVRCPFLSFSMVTSCLRTRNMSATRVALVKTVHMVIAVSTSVSLVTRRIIFIDAGIACRTGCSATCFAKALMPSCALAPIVVGILSNRAAVRMLEIYRCLLLGFAGVVLASNSTINFSTVEPCRNLAM